MSRKTITFDVPRIENAEPQISASVSALPETAADQWVQQEEPQTEHVSFESVTPAEPAALPKTTPRGWFGLVGASLFAPSLMLLDWTFGAPRKTYRLLVR